VALGPDHLERILDAGRHAGSSKNLQRWDFIVVDDREHLRALSAVGPYAENEYSEMEVDGLTAQLLS